MDLCEQCGEPLPDNDIWRCDACGFPALMDDPRDTTPTLDALLQLLEVETEAGRSDSGQPPSGSAGLDDGPPIPTLRLVK